MTKAALESMVACRDQKITELNAKIDQLKKRLDDRAAILAVIEAYTKLLNAAGQGISELPR